MGAILLGEIGLLDAVSQLNRVCLQADWPGSSMELQEETTRITQDLASLVTAP